MKIGMVKPDGTGQYEIMIRTISLTVDCIAIQNPEMAEGRPDYIIQRDGCDIGAAWICVKAGKDNRPDTEDMRARFDSPELREPFSLLFWPVRVPAGAYEIVFERK